MLVESSILDEAAIVVSSEEDDEVERFKEFLDHVSAEDFEGSPGDQEDQPGDQSGDKPGDRPGDAPDLPDRPD